jgi:hypothetical protein
MTMKRHASVAAAAVAAAVLALATTSASAATGNHGNGGNRNAQSHQATARTAVTPALAKPASSLGLIGLDDDQIEVLQALSGGAPTELGAVTDKFAEGIDGTAIDASGTRTLIGPDTSAVASLSAVRTHPTFGGQVNLNQFSGEGGSDFHFFAEGVAIRGTSALVASDSQGVAQLIWTSGGWHVDTRVHFPGLNDAGFEHARGFIAFRNTAADADEFDNAVISPTALRNGKYIGLSIDRGEHTVAVIDGVGTAKPKVALLTNAALGSGSSSFGPDQGSGGLAFSPATPTRAVVTTTTGFAVLNLSNPAKPKLQSLTTVGTPSGAESIGVSADGGHVVEAVDDTAYVYSGLLTTAAGSPLTPVTTIDPGDVAGFIFDVNYLVGGSLALVHGDSTNGYRLDMYRLATTNTPTIESGVKLAAEPEASNTLSVWPSSTTPTIRPARLLRGARVGKHVKQRLRVAGGIGHYTFAVTGGKLPRGLKRHGAVISGTPKRAGRVHVTIAAVNQYGGGVSTTYTVTIKKK